MNLNAVKITLTVISIGVIDKDAMVIFYQLYHVPKPYNKRLEVHKDNLKTTVSEMSRWILD